MLIYNSFQARIPLVIYNRSRDQILHILNLIDIQRLIYRSIIVPTNGIDEWLLQAYFTR